MTVRRNIVVVASAAAAIALALTGCSSGGGGDTAAAGGDGSVEGKEICYITAANSHPYVTPANEGAQAAADAAGVKLTIVSEEFSPQTGAEQLDSCVARGVDGILLWPLDDNSYLPGLLKAEQEGIPVVAIDTTTGDESMALIESFVGADKYDQGKISFEQLDEALGGEGGVVVLAGQAGNGTEIARSGGFMDALEESDSGIEVLATVNADFDQQKALVASRDLLTKYGDQIKGVYAQDDTMAKGFAQALSESGLTITPFVVGINGEKGAFEAIKAGTQYSTIIQPPFRNGELAIETLIAVMQGETVDEMVPLENTVVDSSNVDSLEPAM
ncbi:sugar ABC transporter substrate-binding protein [Agromyces silvae]|uniref:sugar ABC transporter substrate-binding protein n=1 Tax=Agromyces silvae TaxID=3388266 RepID=UPI00280B1329|nr:sugar ABC transporter substrate-binding protein [Agromyces protaetiae]